MKVMTSFLVDLYPALYSYTETFEFCLKFVSNCLSDALRHIHSIDERAKRRNNLRLLSTNINVNFIQM